MFVGGWDVGVGHFRSYWGRAVPPQLSLAGLVGLSIFARGLGESLTQLGLVKFKTYVLVHYNSPNTSHASVGQYRSLLCN